MDNSRNHFNMQITIKVCAGEFSIIDQLIGMKSFSLYFLCWAIAVCCLAPAVVIAQVEGCPNCAVSPLPTTLGSNEVLPSNSRDNLKVSPNVYAKNNDTSPVLLSIPRELWNELVEVLRLYSDQMQEPI